MIQAKPLSDYLANPEIMKPPEPVVTHLAFGKCTTLLVGREKGGKSTLATAGAAAVSRGGHFLGEKIDQGSVLWYALDEPVGGLVRRLVEHQADEETVFILENRGSDAYRTLADAAAKLGPRMIVIDTLDKYALPRNLDSSDAAGWSDVMEGLANVARDTSAAVLVIHHGTKESGRYRDSTAIGAGVDVIATMFPGDEASVRRFEMQARFHVADFSIRLTDLETDGPPRYELAAGELSLDARVLSFIQQHPGTSQRNVRQGVTGRTADVKAAIDRLQERGVVMDTGDSSAASYVAGVLL